MSAGARTRRPTVPGLFAMFSVVGLLVGTSVPVAALGIPGSPTILDTPQEQARRDQAARQSWSAGSAREATIIRRDAVSEMDAPVTWPVPSTSRISDGFGLRNAPTEGASSNHQGADIDAGSGTPVHAIADGEVISASAADDNGCGVNVLLRHFLGQTKVVTKYCHMQVGSMKLKVGDEVGMGQVLGRVGSTGVSTGAHLHFEVHPGGGAAVDPLTWLRKHANR